MHTKHTAAVLLALMMAPSLAQEPPTPVQAYRTATMSARSSCSIHVMHMMMMAELRASTAEPADKADQCIAKAKQSGKEAFDKAREATKSAAALDALKDYHVAYVTALDGMLPGLGERRAAYDSRQQALRDKMYERWARFEIEQ